MSIVAAFAVPHPPLIIPGVAEAEREQISDSVAAYEEVGRHIARIRPETIVISSPHTEMYLDYPHISGSVGGPRGTLRALAPRTPVTAPPMTSASFANSATRPRRRALPPESPASARPSSTTAR